VERKHRWVMIFGRPSDEAKFWGVGRGGEGRGGVVHGWMDGNAKSGVKQSRRYPKRTERRASPSSASSSRTTHQKLVFVFGISQSRRTTGPLTRLTGKV